MEMARKFTAYVDESGDEGFSFRTSHQSGGSSEWFILVAAIVEDIHDQQVAQAINRIKNRLKKTPNIPGWHKPLHWRELRHEQKKVVIQELLQENFTLIAVACEKSHTGTSRERFDPRIVRANNPQVKCPLYFYMARLLIEQITRYVRRNRGRVSVVFENRASLSIPALQNYISFVSTIDKDGGAAIPPNVLAHIEAENKQTRKMLQVADVCAGALFNSLEQDRYGNREDSHILQLAGKFDRVEGKLWGYGMILFPGSSVERVKRGLHYAWMEKL